MRDKELYKQILGIQTPWGVTEVELSMAAVEVTVHVEHDSGVRPACSHFGTPCPGYDQRARTWRHLDTSQFKTLFVAAVPRMTCPTDGVVTIKVPWAKSGSGSPPCMKRSSWTGSGRRRFKPSPVNILKMEYDWVPPAASGQVWVSQPYLRDSDTHRYR